MEHRFGKIYPGKSARPELALGLRAQVALGRFCYRESQSRASRWSAIARQGSRAVRAIGESGQWGAGRTCPEGNGRSAAGSDACDERNYLFLPGRAFKRSRRVETKEGKSGCRAIAAAAESERLSPTASLSVGCWTARRAVGCRVVPPLPRLVEGGSGGSGGSGGTETDRAVTAPSGRRFTESSRYIICC